MPLVSENQLDEWCRANRTAASGTIPELVWRLVSVSAPAPTQRRFALGDSINQPGPDGLLETDVGFPPFIPIGKSVWEIGVGLGAREKANSDYADSIVDIPKAERDVSTFVFVTPLSGVREWRDSWKPDAQEEWRQSKLAEDEWMDIIVLDGTRLVDWMDQFPGVAEWMARRMGHLAGGFETVESRWEVLRTIGDPPPLTAEVFLQNRDEARQRVEEALSQATMRLQLDTHYRLQVSDFVTACAMTLDDELGAEVAGRTVIVHNEEAWRAFATLNQQHVLVADFDLGAEDPTNTRLLALARKNAHVVIFGGEVGGLQSPSRANLPEPKQHQLEGALTAAGYPPERARMLAARSGGNLQSLLRVLQDLSEMPEWSAGTEAAELSIAQLLGGWEEGRDEDEAVVGSMAGKAYGEWIGAIRDIAARPGTPLRHRENVWSVAPRFEAWYALGPRLFDEHLDTFRSLAIEVLGQTDPRFELPKDERYMASIRGKVLPHSSALRRGIADTVALLGSHPHALTSCSPGKGEAVATAIVRRVLDSKDWMLWASVDDYLPLLAEAAPAAYLDAVEHALAVNPSPQLRLFDEESGGVMGQAHIRGLLWGLETIAWDQRYLTRVLVLLGELATIDPGGSWGNRPASSMRDILLPWHPQTVADIDQRLAAVATLVREEPQAAWNLVLALLPEAHQVTSGTRKPAWRETLPSDWTAAQTIADVVRQADGHLRLAMQLADETVERLTALVSKLDDLPASSQDVLLGYLCSPKVQELPEEEREPLWREMQSLVARHRKHGNTDWAMKPPQINKIEHAAEALRPRSPALVARKLFGESDHYLMDEADGDREARRSALQLRRIAAVQSIVDDSGLRGVVELADAVDGAWRVGLVLGAIGTLEIDVQLLPALLDSPSDRLRQAAGGYVRGRFGVAGWDWIDGLSVASWTPNQVGLLLSFLPFEKASWARADKLLGSHAAEYWSRAAGNPYEARDDLEEAVKRLVCNGRPWTAIDILEATVHQDQPLSFDLMFEALEAAATVDSGERVDAHSATELIQTLQLGGADIARLAKVEWLYLPVLDGFHGGARPETLGRELADTPSMFCEMVRAVWRSKSDTEDAQPTEAEQQIAQNAYKLLDGWRTVPGTQADGTVDAAELASWWADVSAHCAETGHLGVAASRFGHVLAFAPSDPTGLWISRAVAEMLDGRDAKEIRRGFTTQLYNSRGIHSYTSGAAEAGLAAAYDVKADEVERAGFHRLAAQVRELADGYRREATREAIRDPFED